MMDLFDPRRPDALPHAGTFNNNVLTMSAGLAGLTEVYTPAAAAALNARGDALRARLNALCRDADAPMQFTGIGSMLAVHMTTRRRSARRRTRRKGDAKLKELFFFDMLAQGIWLARRGMMTLSPADRRCGMRQAGGGGGGISGRAPVAAGAGGVALRFGRPWRRGPNAPPPLPGQVARGWSPLGRATGSGVAGPGSSPKPSGRAIRLLAPPGMGR